jgi:UDP:flavonoid glycosyltransferase YjiC (YdhE family)
MREMPAPPRRPLTIVMLVVGTRGDLVPFLAIARRLQSDGHHIRLATHRSLEHLVAAQDLDYYPIAGKSVTSTAPLSAGNDTASSFP